MCPVAFASSTALLTRSRCASELKGPSSVDSSSGEPDFNVAPQHRVFPPAYRKCLFARRSDKPQYNPVRHCNSQKYVHLRPLLQYPHHQNNHWRFATKFHMSTLNGRRGMADDVFPSGDRTCQRHHPHFGMSGQRISHRFASAKQHVNHASREDIFASSANFNAVSGVISDGLSTTQFLPPAPEPVSTQPSSADNSTVR